MRKLSKKKLNELREKEEKRISEFKFLRNVWMEKVLASAPAELMDILKYIDHVNQIEGEELLDWLGKTDWLMNGDPDWRYLVLRAISDRHSQLTGKFLDDPLPGQSDWFFRARDALHVR